MKTTRYRFEQVVQEVKEENTDWLRDEFRAVLESIRTLLERQIILALV